MSVSNCTVCRVVTPNASVSITWKISGPSAPGAFDDDGVKVIAPVVALIDAPPKTPVSVVASPAPAGRMNANLSPPSGETSAGVSVTAPAPTVGGAA